MSASSCLSSLWTCELRLGPSDLVSRLRQIGQRRLTCLHVRMQRLQKAWSAQHTCGQLLGRAQAESKQGPPHSSVSVPPCSPSFSAQMTQCWTLELRRCSSPSGCTAAGMPARRTSSLAVLTPAGTQRCSSVTLSVALQ